MNQTENLRKQRDLFAENALLFQEASRTLREGAALPLWRIFASHKKFKRHDEIMAEINHNLDLIEELQGQR